MSDAKPKAAPSPKKTEPVATVTVPPPVYSPDEASGHLNPKPKVKKEK